MLCAIYKSLKKEQMYLFVKKRDDFSSVPEMLMTTFGPPKLVTLINLATKDKLGMADLVKVKNNLIEKGFYLQLPPPQENLLKTHKIAMEKQEANSSSQGNQ